MTTHSIFPVTVYGSSISYFTGKLENYFRVKGIPYQFESMSTRTIRPQAKQQTGSDQVPAIKLNDGRWMTDTTPIIQWFENNQPQPAVTPIDPLQRFFSLLLEDYADEWLWRPAMHYRWYTTKGSRFASTHLAEELGADLPVPQWLVRRRITKRQREGYTTGDGIHTGAVPGVEAIYHRTLRQPEAIFRERPFLLGSRPSLADIAFSGPFFRHFGLDPVPAQIMQNTAPAVFHWMARMWDTSLKTCTGNLLDGIPSDWEPLLSEIGTSYLPYLCANVDAVEQGNKRFNVEVGGVSYRGAIWSPYRVWCLAQLRSHFNSLAPGQQETARALLTKSGCWEPLWHHNELPIEKEFCSKLPFHADAKMIDIYD